jgi:2-oxoglutarate dehydrogenase E2 component (dihydrolipoamide succinyltransferase)
MEILMPQLGETVAEGTIATWHKKEGDTVAVDEILMDIETDKVATEVPAPIAGTLSKIHVQEGETVEVGVVLAVIIAEGEEYDDEGDDTTIIPPANMQQAEEEIPVAPAHVEPRASEPASAPKQFNSDAPLSPAVRRLMREHNLDPAQILGTGRNGRIKRHDVLAFIEAGGFTMTGDMPVVAPAAAPATAKASVPAARAPAEDSEDYIPYDRLRKKIADHMVMSKATSPHVLQAVEVDFNNVASVRNKHKAGFKKRNGFSLTFLPFIARATVAAIGDYTHLNGSVEGEGLRIHPDINLAIAVDLNHQGLVAPVIRKAQNYTVAGLAEKINDIAARARDNALTPDDMTGATYTISNSGSFGTLITAPIINQPQVAILSTDGIKKKPVVIEGPEGDSIAIRPVGILAQSFDHRVIDGAYSAAFLRRVQEILETTDWDTEV